MIVSGLVCFILSNFISNTATAALLIPILTVVCAGMGDKLNTIGGTSTILIGVAVSASCAMSLPISTLLTPSPTLPALSSRATW